MSQDLDSVSVGELHVRDHEVERARGEDTSRGGAALRDFDPEALAPQHDREQLAHGRLVVHHEDLLHAALFLLLARPAAAAALARDSTAPAATAGGR